ncbi:MAG: CDP-alcohol phosphatidyltransferase family protein [Candidatus Saccharibacteria bacterium]
MQTKNLLNTQKTLDSLIDKIFLRFIPSSVRPNQVTVVRLILTPVVYWLLTTHQFGLALIVFIIAISTDFIDGAMARTRGQITDLGKVLDPIADKLLIMTVLVSIGFKYFIVKIMVVFIVFELCAVLLGSIFSFAIGKPIGANVFGKIKLILQGFGVGFLMLGILVGNHFLIRTSSDVLYIALFFAIIASLETARRKITYISKHKINLL